MTQPRHDWTLDEVQALFELPFTELMFQAATIHRRWFDPSEVQSWRGRARSRVIAGTP